VKIGTQARAPLMLCGSLEWRTEIDQRRDDDDDDLANKKNAIQLEDRLSLLTLRRQWPQDRPLLLQEDFCLTALVTLSPLLL